MMRSLFFCLSILTVSQWVHADLNSANRALANGDYAAAAREFRVLANAGNARAQANLGYMYYVGEGVPQDYGEAVNWYRKAAAQGDRDAQYNLAVAFAFGEGVAQDFEQAAAWYRRAAEQGHMLAQYSLGISYAYGEGVRQDPREAVRWFTMAAEQGYDRAQVQLGSRYHTGDGVSQDYSEAVRWYRMAADRGNAAAQFNLGTMYRSGRGVSQDYNQALRWFRLAADQGYAPARNELASLERAMAGAARTRATPDIQPAPVSRSTRLSEQGTETAAGMAAPETPAAAARAAEAPLLTVDSSDLLRLEDSSTETETLAAEAMLAADSPVEPAEPAALEDDEDRPGFFRRLFGKMQRRPEPASAPVSPGPATAAAAGAAVTTAATADDADTPETAGEAEERSRPGFFSRLFGRSDDDQTRADSSAVERTTEETVETAQPDVTDTPQQAIAVVEEAPVMTGDTDTADAAETAGPEVNNEPMAGEDSEPVAEPEKRRFGFIRNLFGRGDREAEAEETAGGEPGEVEQLAYADQDATFVADEDDIGQAMSALNSREYQTAFDSFHTLALQGDQFAQYQLASLYYQGLGVDQNYTEAVHWYQRAAEQGEMDAQYSLGNMYLMGEGIEQSDDKAAYWYTRAAEQGHDSARHNLRNLERVARQAGRDSVVEKARQAEPEPGPEPIAGTEPVTEPEPETGQRGFFSRLFGREEAPAAASASSTTAAGTEDAAEKPGFFGRLFGRGEEEPEPQVAYADDSADQNKDVDNAIAILQGETTPEQEAEVIAAADYERGLQYSLGDGVEQDSAEAFRLFMKAAEQGYAPAQYKVGVAYAYGDGVEHDAIEAANWYRQAAQQGYTLAQRNLGVMYALGEGLQQDKPLALAWYSVVAENGNVMDIRRRDMLERELTETERQRAMQLKEELQSYIYSE